MPAWAVPVLPTEADEVVDQRTLGQAQLAPGRSHGAGVTPGHDRPVDLLRGDRRGVQRRGPRLLRQRGVLALAEPFLPLLRAGLAGQPPAVEELLGGRATADQLGPPSSLSTLTTRTLRSYTPPFLTTTFDTTSLSFSRLWTTVIPTASCTETSNLTTL